MVKRTIINIVENYINSIPKELKTRKAFLFGSFVRGNQNKDSDIDIAIIVENIGDFFTTQLILMKTRRNIDLRIEPHPIDIKDFNENNPFAKEIMDYGIEINFDKPKTT